MISCEHAQNLFEAYLNDEVPASLVAELDAHCLNCANCRQQLSLLEACGNVVRLDTSEPAVSGDFTQRLVKILEEDQSERRILQLGRRMKLVGGLVGIAAALGLAAVLPIWPNDDFPQVKPAHTSNQPAFAGSRTTPSGSHHAPDTVSGALLSDFLGAPFPFRQMVEGFSAAVELSEITADKMNDAAVSEQPPIHSLPIMLEPADDAPDVLETLPEEDGELL